MPCNFNRIKSVRLMEVVTQKPGTLLRESVVHIHEYPHNIEGFLCGAHLDGIDHRIAEKEFWGRWDKATCPSCLAMVAFCKALE